MLETTENVGLFLPIIFALFVSFGVGRIYNRSLYVGTIRIKNIPFLVEKVPRENEHMVAKDIMSENVKSLKRICKVSDVHKALKCEEFNGFPVLDNNGKLLGLISRNFLIIILKNKAWFNKDV